MLEEKTEINENDISLSSPKKIKQENEITSTKENEFSKEKITTNSNLSTGSASNKKNFYKQLSNKKEISNFKANIPSTNNKKRSLIQNQLRDSKTDRGKNATNKKNNKLIETKNNKKTSVNNSHTIPQNKTSRLLSDNLNNLKYNNKIDNNIKTNNKEISKEPTSITNKIKDDKLYPKQNEKDEKKTNIHNNNLKITEEKRSSLKKESNNTNKFKVINKPFKPKKLGSSLYIPHVVLDPLDIIKTRLNKVLKGFNDKIINISQSTSLVDISMQNTYTKIYDDYTTELKEIYMQKENKLMQINDKYEQVLYKMLQEYGKEDNILYDELLKEKEEQLENLEKDFINSKKELKLKFQNKVEELKRNAEENKQKIIDKELLDEVKNQIIEVFVKRNENLSERRNQSNYNKKNKYFDTYNGEIKEIEKIK